MSNWNDLSMQERAEIMKLAVSDGIYDLGTIRDAYNEYANGGSLPPKEEWTMEDENGYQIWRGNLPDNLKYTDDSQYNMREAYKAGLQPILNEDGYYHLGSRNPKTGKILKSATHPTLPLALLNDAQQGYYPTVDSRGNIYTQTWKGNELKEGGSIHIKPSHRGRLTELKERTGKSEAELYNDGNPAHKKMVVFARNARKWKHGDGGNLFDDGGDKDNIFKYTNSNGDVRYVYQDSPEDEEVPVRPLNTIFPDPAQWTFIDDAGKFYTPRRTTPTNTAELNPDNRTGFERALDNYIGEAFNTVPKGYHTLPAIGAAAFGLANPVIGEAALTSGFGAHGLSKWINGGINGPLDAAMTALEVTPLGRLVRPMWNAGKEGLQYTAKVADNATRYASPSYDLYRTIGETTPSVRVRDPYVDVKGLKGTDKSYIKIKSSLENLTDTKRGNKNEAYYLFAPKYIDILKLRNARFGNGKAYDGPILGSGSVDGKFVSYGEPWMEFAPSERTALYEMPTGPRRGPNLMATDFRGNRMDYSVNEAYNAVLRDRQFHQDIENMELGDILQFKRDNYPDLIEGIPTDIYHANQTVVPNKKWNFDWFLKTPFWKYSENPISGQVQKELMMKWPEAKPLETPTIEWADAAKTPQITAENAASITPEQWTAAQDAAIAKGDMAEAQRLRDLHFNVYGDPIISYHGQMMPDEMYRSRRANPYSDVRVAYNASGYFSSSSNPVANTYNFIDGSPTFKLYTHFKNPYIIDAKGGNWRTIGTDKIYRDYVEKGKHDGAVIRNVMDVGPRRDKLNGASDIADDIISSPGHSKLADAVTYDDNGVRIPLGSRDNFNINDIRYGLLPFLGLGAAGTLYGKQE